MDRVSLSPIAHTDLDLPCRRWWQGWVPRPTRLPAVAWAVVGRSARRVGRAVSGVSRLLRTDLRADGRGRRQTVALRRIGRGLAVQALVVPIGLLAVAVVVVQRGVHPTALTSGSARLAGVYGERIDLTAADGVVLSALWVPATTAGDVATRGNRAIDRPRPAVLLVHDHGHDLRQLLPAARQLHEAGLHVLLLDSRGAGTSAPAARTFGEREALDVAAAIDHLRRRPTVDPERVAAWGVGYGARAILNADLATPLALAVAEDRPDPAVDSRFVPPGAWYDAVRPACRWVFAVLHAAGPSTRPAPPRRLAEVGSVAEAVAEVTRQFDPNLHDREVTTHAPAPRLDLGTRRR